MTPSPQIERAIRAEVPHNGDDFDEAIAACRAGLNRNPHRADLLCLRGLLAQGEGLPDFALACLGRAAALAPDSVEYLTEYGDALRENGRPADAVSVYLRALQRSSHHSELYWRIGAALAKQGHAVEALALFAAAARLNDSLVAVHRELGDVLIALNRPDAAVQQFEIAVLLAPDNADLWHRLGNAQLLRHEWHLALNAFERGIELQPDVADLHVGIAEVRIGLGQIESAIDALDKAVSLQRLHTRACRLLVFAMELLGRRRDSASAWCRLGEALEKQHLWADAEHIFHEALARKGDCIRTLTNLGQLCTTLARPHEAAVWFERALAVLPDHVPARHGLACAALLTGDRERAKLEDTWCFHHAPGGRRYFKEPRWDGDSAADAKTVLIWSNGGLGDAIQWCRFLPLIKAQGTRVILEVDALLLPLFRHLRSVDALCAYGSPLPEFDAQATLGQLHWIFEREGTLANRMPYLEMPREIIEQCRRRFGSSPTVRIGLVWGAGPVQRSKSMSLASLVALGNMTGVRLVSLQMGSRADELLAPPLGLHIEQVLDPSATLEDTAAVISSLHLVISVDTMVVHLAGALGVPVWAMIPYGADWRWGLQGDTTDWYPTMRLFRQPRPGDWDSVVENVRSALQEQLTRGANPHLSLRRA